MTVPDVISLAVGVLGIGFGAYCYRELWKWARQCEQAKIAIAYKRKVQLTAPLTEWLGWANLLGREEASRGRIIYRNGGVSVAVLRPLRKQKVRNAIRRVRRNRRGKPAKPE